ncbi:PR domain zinc finger protein 5-like [Eurosta solidaginis]|uniref:PR domain zinc finger protein 5-like n=1 Tax=Eurosta solidaginis TaxID=178769 RepID=UPI0035312C2F
MDSMQCEDNFSEQLISPDGKGVALEEIYAYDDDSDSLDEMEDIRDDVTIVDIAIAKTIANVNPTLFMHLLCPRCGKTFKSPALWQQHLDGVHYFNNLKNLPGILNDETFKCKKCTAKFNYLDYRKILIHCLSHMTFNTYYKCSLCEHLGTTGEEIARHIKRHMKVHMLKAKINGIVTNAKRFSLNEHVDYEKFLIFTCPECQASFRKHDAWLQHVSVKHALFAHGKLQFETRDSDDEDIGNKSYLLTTCEICATTLAVNNVEESQRKHYLTHLRYRSFRCAICDLHFNYRTITNYSNEIKMHMLLLHCNNIETYEEAVLPTHLRPNNTKFNMNRKFCADRSAKYLPYIQYNCPICNVKFDNADNWRVHINENHDFFKAPYMALLITSFSDELITNGDSEKRSTQPYCILCDQVLERCTGYQDLWKEQLRHAPYHSYTCRICLNQFHAVRYLIRHCRMKHTNEDGSVNTETRKEKRKRKRKVKET